MISTRCLMWLVVPLLACPLPAAARAAAEESLPIVVIDSDNVAISTSCRVRIDPAATIADRDNNGVIHIRTSGITLEFEDSSALWGGPRPAHTPLGPWDRFTGIGIRIDGARDVTIRNARVHGFKVGIWATNCDHLTIDGADLSDNYRQRLKSTPEAEDSTDWLFPHRNDKDEWATQHGAAVYVRRSEGAVMRGVRVRRGQNGILLHSVNGAQIYDNDCSFLSGWGLGLFRSSRNLICRNAFDFCVRGHSEGVYNRGQDSAGILMFEQCSNNLVIENSCTHGGDGIFGFAGLEAVNGEGAAADFAFARRGCNDNVFVGNDLSYAPAHGLEMTFSFGNIIRGNRFVENAICGIWGGYSQETLIGGNEFVGNGGMAYGLERGGVNIEHGANNRIIDNDFVNNRCAVHLWWDPHGDFEAKAWGKANYRGVMRNIVADNRIGIDKQHPFGAIAADRKLIGLHIRDEGDAVHVQDTVYARNEARIDPTLGIESVVHPGVTIITEWDGGLAPLQELPRKGEARPVGARAHLRGRHNIVMGPWGPWDHESLMVRHRSASAEGHVYEVFGASDDIEISSGLKQAGSAGPSAVATLQDRAVGVSPSGPRIIRVVPGGDASGVFPYAFNIRTRNAELPIRGMIIRATWDLAAFSWNDATDPRNDLAAWRALAEMDSAVRATVAAIAFNYGHGGPRDQPWARAHQASAPGADRFGMIARTRLTLGKGSWRFTTLSDDGVRVLVDGKPVIENWTWHAPTRDTGVFTLEEQREVELVVEHFEIDGYAVLELDIAPAD